MNVPITEAAALAHFMDRVTRPATEAMPITFDLTPEEELRASLSCVGVDPDEFASALSSAIASADITRSEMLALSQVCQAIFKEGADQ